MHRTTFHKIYIAVTYILKELTDLLINKIVKKTYFIHNMLDFPIFATKIGDYTHPDFKEIVKTCAKHFPKKL